LGIILKRNNTNKCGMQRLKSERINLEYFRLFKQFPLMLKLSLKKRFRIMPTEPKKILIVDTTLIGDFISTLPALEHFICNNKAEVDLVVSSLIEPLAKHVRGVNRVFSTSSIYQRHTEKGSANKERLSDYDFILVIQMGKDAYNLLKNAEYKKVKTSVLPYLLYGAHLVKNLSKKDKVKQHEEFTLEFVGGRDFSKEKVNFEDIFTFGSEDYKNVEKLPFLKNKKSKKVVIHTGSGWYVKHWKNERWVELLERIRHLGNFEFVFVGGTEKEENDFNYIKSRLDFKVYSVIRKLDLKDITLMMNRCDYFIGVDSGPRHIAHLLNMPSICLLGPGPKIFSPHSRNAIFLDKSNCYCTNLFCYRKMPCVEKISTDEVFKEFEKFIKR